MLAGLNGPDLSETNSLLPFPNRTDPPAAAATAPCEKRHLSPYLQLPAANPLHGVFEGLDGLLGDAGFLAPSLGEAGGVLALISALGSCEYLHESPNLQLPLLRKSKQAKLLLVKSGATGVVGDPFCAAKAASFFFWAASILRRALGLRSPKTGVTLVGSPEYALSSWAFCFLRSSRSR